MDVIDKARGIVRELVEAYASGQAEMPDEWARAASGIGAEARLRLVSDFVAGMTDRYAIEQHRALFDHTPELR